MAITGCCGKKEALGVEENESDTQTVSTDADSEEGLERGTWGRQLDFMLSCVGYAVGLGNLWRFPYLCMRNGGGAFLIPYFIFLFLCGMPLYLLELSIGQFASLSPTTIWKVCPLFSGMGYAMILVSGIVCIYYNVILAWALYYIVKSFTTGVLPWASCNNAWNTPSCVERLGRDSNTSLADLLNLTKENSTTIHASNGTGSPHRPMTSAEEFWHYNVLDLSDSIEDVGHMRWELVGCLILAWLLIFMCMFKGIKSTGKVVYVTAIAPFIMLAIFIVRGLMLPGAMTGIKYYLLPDFNQLLNFQVWSEACAQIFYSLGAAYGSLITMASYSRFSNNCYRDALIIPIINCGTSFLAGFAIFSVIGFMAVEAGLPVKDVITSGPGLAFVVYPEALTKLPISPMWAIIFFLMLVILGLDTQFGMFECLISGFIDLFPNVLRKRQILFTAAMCVLQLLIGLPLVSQGGIYIFQLFDWYSATFSLITISFLECVVLSWCYGLNRVYEDMEMMIGYKPCGWWKICWGFITPTILLAVLLCTVVNFSAPTYGHYAYPSWALGVGWFLALISLMPIPGVMIIKLLTTEGTIVERLKFLLQPASDWGPALKKDRTGHYANMKVELNKPVVVAYDTSGLPVKETSTGMETSLEAVLSDEQQPLYCESASDVKQALSCSDVGLETVLTGEQQPLSSMEEGKH